MKAYSEELVHTRSEDGVLLDGVVIRPSGNTIKETAVVWNHGYTGHYDEPFILTIGQQAAARGYTFVAGNNRGHHFGVGFDRRSGEPLLGGGWWERLEDAPYDVGGWLRFAEQLGFSRLVLAGHSLGTLKVTEYQAQRQDPAVVAMILASPPVTAFENLSKNRNGAFEDEAARLIAAGRGEELVPSPLGGQISAQTYNSWMKHIFTVFAGQSSESAITQLRPPLLVLYGTDEGDIIAMSGVDDLRLAATGVARFDTREIVGADHVYTGHESEAGKLVAG